MRVNERTEEQMAQDSTRQFYMLSTHCAPPRPHTHIQGDSGHLSLHLELEDGDDANNNKVICCRSRTTG